MTSIHVAPKNPRTARFYHLPKIHKAGHPGRPIVSSCGAPTERISEFVDHHLKPLVQQTPSYIRDTTDFLQKLSGIGSLPPNCILATLDVSSLYTNIPHQEGIQACRDALNRRPRQQPSTDCLTEMIEQILTLNNFMFDDENYLQNQGTAMGTRMAPSYANLFMAELEQKILSTTTTRPLLWWRCIDDIFTIWEQGPGAFPPRNKRLPPTAETSTDRVLFLDTMVILEGDTIRTDLYTKPTDKHQYLSPESCHPRHCTSSIPYSQSLRLRRICSTDQDFRTRTKELKTYLTARGYDGSVVDLQIDRAASLTSERALQPSGRQEQTVSRVPLVVSFYPGLPRLNRILRRHLPVLHISERLQQAIPEAPLLSFRRPPNLRDMLVRAQLKTPAPPTNTGNAPCGGRRCKTCNLIMNTNSFKSHCMGRTYKTRSSFTCKTNNIVYLIQCKKCEMQYVGETENALHIRLNGHRSDVKTKKLDKPVAAHFNLPDHTIDDLEVMGIEKIHSNDPGRRRLRESYWIFELETMAPRGLNLED